MYKAPVEEIAFTLKHVAGVADAMEQGLLGDLSEDLLDAILTEAGRFAEEEVAPLADNGDKQGARLIDGAVRTPDGWADLYKRWAEGGWNSLACPEEFGGQHLPQSLYMATLEMWNSCSMAFTLGPALTIGAIEAINAHGSDALKEKYLPKMVSGEWMGSMNLTEPGAGTDLGGMKTRAERRPDGTYRIFGQKIFITYGEHDFTDNIVHLVLARLPDAPKGSKGISLFLVPKFFVNDDGSLGARNDLHCHSIEHKLGIHGSPTCTMIYGDGKFGSEAGAVGWLIGEENNGLAAMFTMMNNERLGVGMQGVGISEVATQKATAYARERLQGRAPGWKGEGMSPIIEHPDIARTLLTMKALTQGSRAITYACAFAIDMAARLEPGEAKRHWQERANLLTPIAKSFPTDAGVEVASHGIQVHGGMGFIEETGAARYYRDIRIAPIYEGTNGVQAGDLVGRKLPQSGALVMVTNGLLDWAGQWHVFGAVTLVLLIPAWFWMPAPDGAITARAAGASKVPHPGAWLLNLSYFCAGVGFVVSATFVVAAAAKVPQLTHLGPFIWIVVGVAAIPATLAWDRLARRIGDVPTLILAYALQIVGIVLPVVSHSAMAAIGGALLFGATFMGIVALTLALAGKRNKDNPSGAMARLTLSYGVAQIVAPAVVGRIAESTGSYDTGMMMAAITMVAGIVLLWAYGRAS